MRLRRLILFGLGGLLIAWLGLPAVIGLILEGTHPQVLAGLDERLSSASLRPDAFDRGWFSSTSRSAIVAADGSELALQTTYRHGPWADGPAWLAIEARVLHPEQDPVGRLDAVVDWLLDIDGSLRGRWRGADANSTTDLFVTFAAARGGNRLEATIERLNLTGPHLEVAGGNGTVTLDDLNAPLPRVGLDVSAQRLRLPDLDLDRPTIALGLTRSGDDARLAVRLDAERWQGFGENWRAPSVAAALDRLPAPTLGAALGRIRELLDADPPPEVLAARMNSEVLLILPPVLAHRPLLQIESLSGRSADGPVAGRLTLTLDAAPPAGFLSDPARLGKVAVLDAHLAAPESAFRRWAEALARAQAGPWASPETVARAATDQFDRWRANRVIVSDDAGRYVLEASYRDQLLTLNGMASRLPTL